MMTCLWPGASGWQTPRSSHYQADSLLDQKVLVELDGMLTSGMRPVSVTGKGGSTLTSYAPVMGDEEVLTVYGEVEAGAGTEQVTLVDSVTTSRTYGKMAQRSGQ